MATYDLKYPGAAIDAILDTAYHLQQAGYIFRGSASDYSGTPSKRVWLIAPAGFSGLGLSSAVPKGSFGICLYNGTAWVGKVINVLTLDSKPTRNSQNGVTSGGVAATLDAIAGGIMETFASLLFDDETASADLRTKLSYAVKFSVSDVYQTVTHLNILAATTSKAGLMSAEDKAKVDSFLTGIRSMQFVDATTTSEQAIKLVEQLKWTVGGVQEVIDSITLLAATSSKAGLLSASDKAYIDALPATLTSLSNSISGALALMQSMVGYYVCDTAAGTAAKTVAATGYSLTNGGCIRIKMTNANTAANVTLNINSTGAKALYYDGAQASSTNTWEAGEVLEVYYDGTQYQCVSSGGGRADRVKYDNTGSGLSADNVQDAIDEISDDTEQLMNDVYGEPTQQTGTWGNWTSAGITPQRIFVICDQLSVLDGVISVKLSDYSTYRCGIVIQRGTAWASSVVSDTGWKTEDTTKVIAENEVGYYIRVSLSRIDNGAISPSDAASIISSLSYTYIVGGGAGIISSIKIVNAKLGYYECTTEAGTAAKTVAATGYKLTDGGCIRIKMTNGNTADNVTLNINSTGAKALYYDGAQASSTNTWEAGEVLEVYYDGTQYQCASGGCGKFATGEKVKDVGITNQIEDNDKLITSGAVYGLTDDSTIDLSQLTSQVCSLGTNTWYRNGSSGPQRHIALPVIAGQKIILSASITPAQDNFYTYYAWCTSSYSPPYSSGQSVPMVAGETSRIRITTGASPIVITAPNDAAYLVMTTVDGSGVPISWTAKSPAKLNFKTGERINEVGITDELVLGGDDLITTGGVAEKLNSLGLYMNPVDLSILEPQACSLGTTKWYLENGQKHKAIPVVAGQILKLSATISGIVSGTAWYAFVTSSYSPPYANNSAIPLVPSEAERFGLALGSEITVTAPAQSAYLIITTFDGGNHSVDWSVEMIPANIYEKIQEIDVINERVDELSLTVDGVSEEGTGTWGDLTLRENTRVFTICGQKTYTGGVIKVKISDYSTYYIGMTIQDGTSYSSTAIYDTGWKSSDIEHIVKYNEAGYNIRVSFRRANNGSLTVQDVQNVLTLLSYEYNYYESGLVEKVGDIENAEVYKPQRIPMKVIGEMHYVGNKIDLQEHPFTASQIGTLSSTGSYLQGAAVFGKYLFQFHNTNDSVNVFNLETQQEVQTISLTANPNCHANTASFGGQFYDVNDEFPCVYVSSEGEKKTYVYRITGTEGAFVLTLVQTLSYDTGYYYPNLNVDAPNNRGVLVGYKENSWQVAEGNKMMCCCFNLPAVTDGDKTLINPYNEFSFPFIYATQGVFSKYGKMYHSFGNTSAGLNIGGILVVDYLLKNVVSFIDLNAVGSFELEGLGMYDGGFVLTTQSRTIYKIDFP